MSDEALASGRDSERDRARASIAAPGSNLEACFSKAQELTAVCEILRAHLPGLEVRIFGSRARGTTKRFADLDLLVLSRETIEPLRWALLDEAFAESDLPFKVDLLDARDVEPGFRDRLMAGSVLIQAPEA